jgi:AraC-like DNA-binding protein
VREIRRTRGGIRAARAEVTVSVRIYDCAVQQSSAEPFGSKPVARAVGCDEASFALSRVFLPVRIPSAAGQVPLEMTLNAVKADQVTVGFLSFNSEVHVVTAEPIEYHVDIPLDGHAVMKAGGNSVHASRDTGAVFMPGRPAELFCSRGFAQLAIMVSRIGLESELVSLLGRPCTSPLEFKAAMDVTSPAARTMMQAIRLMDQASREGKGMLQHPLAVQNLERALMHSLLFAQSHNYIQELDCRAPQPGVRPVARAAALLRECPERPWTVAELAAEVSVSVRSLQEGFQRTFDTTPTRFLRDVRLCRAHKQLSEADPTIETVAGIAMRWGFAHLGRFAGEYRRTFGARPSDTLRSAPSRRESRDGFRRPDNES